MIIIAISSALATFLALILLVTVYASQRNRGLYMQIMGMLDDSGKKESPPIFDLESVKEKEPEQAESSFGSTPLEDQMPTKPFLSFDGNRMEYRNEKQKQPKVTCTFVSVKEFVQSEKITYKRCKIEVEDENFLNNESTPSPISHEQSDESSPEQSDEPSSVVPQEQDAQLTEPTPEN